MQTQELVPTFQIQDDRFSIEKLNQYILIMELGFENLRFTIYDEVQNLFIWLEDYKISGLEELAVLFQTHSFLAANYWSGIAISILTPFKTLLPKSEIDSANLALSYLYPEDDFDTLIFDNQGANALVYGMDKNLKMLLDNIYKEAKSIALIPKEANCLLVDGLHLNFSEINVSMCLVKNGNMEQLVEMALGNNLRITKSIPMFIPDIFEQDPTVWLSGQISNYSLYYQYIIRKFSQVKFIQVPAGLRFSQYFQDLSESKYFTLFSNIKYFKTN